MKESVTQMNKIVKRWASIMELNMCYIMNWKKVLNFLSNQYYKCFVHTHNSFYK